MEKQGTRRAFQGNPVKWYSEFWLPNFAPERMSKPPNAGHEALAALASAPGVAIRVVTQNVDGLHRSTATAWDSEALLVEVHGRIGLYKCSSCGDHGQAGVCPYAKARSIVPAQFSEDMRQQLGHGHGGGGGNGGGFLTEVPPCPGCSGPCLPQALLFDEDYSDHAFYQFAKVSSSPLESGFPVGTAIQRTATRMLTCDQLAGAVPMLCRPAWVPQVQEWLAEAEVLVFVGTSFAVTITALAIREHGRRRGLPMFNFNIDSDPERLRAATLDWVDVCGPAEVTLPALAALCGVLVAAR